MSFLYVCVVLVIFNKLLFKPISQTHYQRRQFRLQGCIVFFLHVLAKTLPISLCWGFTALSTLSSAISLPNHTYWAGLVLKVVNQYCAHSFARNWQLLFLNQPKGENDHRKKFNLHERILPTRRVYQLEKATALSNVPCIFCRYFCFCLTVVKGGLDEAEILPHGWFNWCWWIDQAHFLFLMLNMFVSFPAKQFSGGQGYWFS